MVFYLRIFQDFLLIFLAVSVFVTLNMIWGQIILGDFGAYWLSGLIALVAFDLYSSTGASIWFFGSILSYPCFEIVRVILVRFLNKKSPLVADNMHTHNEM